MKNVNFAKKCKLLKITISTNESNDLKQSTGFNDKKQGTTLLIKIRNPFYVIRMKIIMMKRIEIFNLKE